MAFGKTARREEPPEVSLDLRERLAPYGDEELTSEPVIQLAEHRGDVRLVIVDDMPAIRTMMTLAVSVCEGITVVGEAGGATDAVDICARVQPDAILLEVDMPEIDGTAAIPLLRRVAPVAKVVVYSNDNASRQASLDAGADAFLWKLDTRPADVLGQIKSICSGTSPVA